MKNQFFYTRKVELPKVKGEEPKFKEYEDSFNPEFVIRTVREDDGSLLVLLNDIHERFQEVPQFDGKRTKIVGYTKQRNTFQSEINLSPEDAERYKKLTTIEQ